MSAGRSITIPLEALAPILALLAPLVAERNAESDDSDPWIPHTAWPFPHPTRAATRIQGARKIGRVWLARRSALDAFIESHPTHSRAKPANDAPSTLTPMARAIAGLGFAPVRKAVKR